jgi:hypothetical protein
MKENNSLVTIATDVLIGILMDLQSAYPSIDLSLDLQRLRTQIASRGIGFVSLDLPNLDKQLLAGLESGSLPLRGPLMSRKSKKVRVPKFLSGLWLKIFDVEGCLKAEPDINAIAFLRQLALIGKRLVGTCSDSIIKDAIGDFYHVDEQLRSIELFWFDQSGHLDPRNCHFNDGFRDHSPDVEQSGEDLLRNDVSQLQWICDCIAIEHGIYDPYALTWNAHKSEPDAGTRRYFRHGPGAVSDLSGKRIKYQFPSWPSWLQRWFPYDAFARHDFSVDDMPEGDDIAPSKLLAVPKTMDKPRLIAAEPACLQWCQQLTSSYIREVISSTWIGDFIDLTDQSKSATMVSEASLDGSLATIDLSSASDRLSAWSVMRMFRKNSTILDHLRAHRSMYVSDYMGIRESYLLNKFATQGTAVTFPVQSLFFLACAITCSLPSGAPKRYNNGFKDLVGKVRVFGDDIIMPNTGYERLKNLLSFLQLKVNDDKSFAKGRFRESCGADCFMGYDITPVKPKTLVVSNAESFSSVIDTANNLFKKGFWHASKAVEESSISFRSKFLRIISMDSDLQGLCSYSGGSVRHLPYRYNYDIHQLQVRVLSVTTTVAYTVAEGSFNFFQHVVESLFAATSPALTTRHSRRLLKQTTRNLITRERAKAC